MATNSLDKAYQGTPLAYIPVSSSIDLTKMDYAYQGQPLVTNLPSEAPTTNIKAINGLAYSSIKAFNGLAKSSIKNLNGLA